MAVLPRTAVDRARSRGDVLTAETSDGGVIIGALGGTMNAEASIIVRVSIPNGKRGKVRSETMENYQSAATVELRSITGQVFDQL